MKLPAIRLFGRILLLFILVRTVLAVWMWGVRQILPEPLPPDPILRPYLNVAPDPHPWLEPWQRWDTIQYQAIAERGYTSFSTALFTPPLYPLLIRLAAPLFDQNTLLAGLVISGIACLLCLLVIERTSRFELGNNSEARRSVLYLVSFPTAFFLFAGYTEALFLLAGAASLFAARRKKWIPAGLWGAVTALTRAPGLLIAIPLAYAAWSAWRNGDRKGVWAIAITLGGAALFPAYVWFGLHLPPAAILSAVGRGGSLTFPGANIVEAVRHILDHQFIAENSIELISLLILLPVTFFIWRDLPRIYGVYALTYLLLFLMRMGAPQPLVSMERYILEIFPMFMVFARWGNHPWVNRLFLYTSWVGLLFFSGQFAIWGWAG